MAAGCSAFCFTPLSARAPFWLHAVLLVHYLAHVQLTLATLMLCRSSSFESCSQAGSMALQWLHL